MTDIDFGKLISHLESSAENLVSQFLRAVEEQAGEGRGATSADERRRMHEHMLTAHSVPSNWLPREKDASWLKGFHEALFYGSDETCNFDPENPLVYYHCVQCGMKIHDDQTEAEDQPIWLADDEIFCHAGPSPKYSRFHVPAE